ncbi:UNVERIFIED_CONTAM: hypothetical protein FKN15_019995 [Acipenser sinensis]
MSVIEDGDLAEVLYLIPKQSMLRQLPNLNPNDYYLCERLMDVAIDPRLSTRAEGFVEHLEGFGSFAHGDSSPPLGSNGCLQVLWECAGEEDRDCLRT